MWHDITHALASTAGWLTLAAATGAGITLGLLGAAAVLRTRRVQLRQAGHPLRWLLVALAVAAAFGVAVIGGVRSFEAVSERFGSPLVPLTGDGMIVACTALRIAALTRGWRIPGALATTYLFIGGTVWLNVAAAHDWSAAVAHALAPISYAILVEMLAHLLRLHLHLANPPRQRVAALAWATSPVITTRVWLHLARTGTDNPVAARALVQQLVRLSSRLRMVCSSRRPWPFCPARRARTAALQTVRDGLLTAGQLADLLPAEGHRIAPPVLLARVDQAALRSTAPASADAPLSGAPDAPEVAAPEAPTAGAPEAAAAPRADASAAAPRRRSRRVNGSAAGAAPRRSAGPSDGRSDAELVAELHHMGGPLSVRKIQRLLGVGWPRAKRLADKAGWTDPAPPTAYGQSAAQRPAVTETEPPEHAESKPADHVDSRTTP
jgi:uncharacterized protein DUF2637